VVVDDIKVGLGLESRLMVEHEIADSVLVCRSVV
jgi:hypothetical protein